MQNNSVYVPYSPPKNAPVALVNRRVQTDRRQDKGTRAAVHLNVLLKQAAKLPPGPKKAAALAYIAQLPKDTAGASDRRHAPDAARGWTDKYFYP